MLPKPSSCLGCPFYGNGHGFVPDVLVVGAPVLVLAQAPGADEEAGNRVVEWVGGKPVYEKCSPQPLIGRTGWAMDGYLARSGLNRLLVSRCSAIKCRPEAANNRGKMVKTNELPGGKDGKKAVAAALQHCSQYLVIPEYVKLVVASGALAWKAMGGPGSITEWRGHLMPKKGT